jgi:sugar lactone lactonase YvrE
MLSLSVSGCTCSVPFEILWPPGEDAGVGVVAPVVEGLADPRAIAFDGTFFYVAEFFTGRVLRFLPDGSELTPLYQKDPFIYGVYPRDGELVFAMGNPSTSQVRLPLDGGTPLEQPLSLSGYSTAMSEGGLVIGADPGVWLVDANGVTSLLYTTYPDGVGVMGLEGGTLFFSDNNANAMFELTSDAVLPTQLDQLDSPWGLHVDATAALWVDGAAGKVRAFERDTGRLSVWQSAAPMANDVVEYEGKFYVTGEQAGTLSVVDPADGGTWVLWQNSLPDGGDAGSTWNVIATPLGLYWTNENGTVLRMTP